MAKLQFPESFQKWWNDSDEGKAARKTYAEEQNAERKALVVEYVKACDEVKKKCDCEAEKLRKLEAKHFKAREDSKKASSAYWHQLGVLSGVQSTGTRRCDELQAEILRMSGSIYGDAITRIEKLIADTRRTKLEYRTVRVIAQGRWGEIWEPHCNSNHPAIRDRLEALRLARPKVVEIMLDVKVNRRKALAKLFESFPSAETMCEVGPTGDRVGPAVKGERTDERPTTVTRGDGVVH